MKPNVLYGITGSLLLMVSGALAADQTAQVQLFNGSVRMHPGPCDCGFGLEFNLGFSTVATEWLPTANGEVAPHTQPAEYSHWSYLILEDVSMVSSYTFAQLNVPVYDNNGNGIPDLFDVSSNVGITTQGTYESEWGPGTLSLGWSRTAGSTQGKCEITLKDRILGDMGPFHLTFEIIHFSGTLAYRPGEATVSGSVSLSRSGSSQDSVQGQVHLVKATSDPFNSLALQAGAWDYSGSSPLSFDNATLVRDPARPSRYRATLQTQDGSYAGWTLAIQDLNDSDKDGIPDLSDLPLPALRPTLSLAGTPAGLELTITGQAGRSYQLQEAASPAALIWDSIANVTLEGSTRVVPLPALSNQPRFWRLLAQ